VTDLRKSFPGVAVPIVDGMSFDVGHQEFVSIVGPSGCGKTTLLRLVCGLLAPDAGEIRLQDRRVTTPPPEMAIVFQDYGRSLFPWLTVQGNVMFPLKERRDLSKTEKHERVAAALEEVGLTEAVKRYPWQLSGGMQQRVAIARAVAARPQILLMDEPFASVDALTRADLEDLVLRLHADDRMTVLLVTHDIDEAVYLSDRVFVLRSRPATVVESVEIDLPRPRRQLETRSAHRFLELRNHILGLVGARGAVEVAPDEEAAMA
jgi:NitT/TauT family transport system ATP-binding protein